MQALQLRCAAVAGAREAAVARALPAALTARGRLSIVGVSVPSYVRNRCVISYIYRRGAAILTMAPGLRGNSWCVSSR